MRPNRDMEAIARARRVASDTEDLVNIADAARAAVLMIPPPDVTKDPKAAAAYQRLRAAIEKYMNPSERADGGE